MNLSGGNKRKLSVAIAMLPGNSIGMNFFFPIFADFLSVP
jgi:hypothetical protein